MNPIARSIARFVVGLVLLLMFISGIAQLAGCHVTRQFPSAQAAPTMQPASCSNWDECA